MTVYKFSDSGAVGPAPLPSTAPEPRPLYVTEEQVKLIEIWAANAVAHGNQDAWGVLTQVTLWRLSS